MTSQINYTAIDASYPVAGQDNDSQGFRDNFAATQAALATAKTEITKLQQNAVLKASLADNTATDNDLLSSTITNGSYSEFYGVSYGTITINSSLWNINVTDGYLQSFNASAPFGLTFTGWPETGQLAKVRLQFANTSSSPIEVTIDGEAIVKSSEFPTVLSLPASSKVVGVDIWSFNAGTTIFVEYLGVFDQASDSRNIVGNLVVEGDTSVVQLNAASIEVSGLTNLGETTIDNLTVTGDLGITGGLTVNGTTTLGNATADTVSFVGIPKLPSISTSDRNALTSQVGMLIYNISTSKVQVCTTGGTPGTWADLN